MPHEEINWITQYYDSLHPVTRYTLTILSLGMFSMAAWIGRRQLTRIDRLEEKAATTQDIEKLRDHFDRHINYIKSDMRTQDEKIDQTNKKIDQILFHVLNKSRG